MFFFSIYRNFKTLGKYSSFVQKILENRDDAIEQYYFIEEEKIAKLGNY